VYASDRRGRGESGATAPHAVEREVEVLAALIANAGASAFVCGLFSGAALALLAPEEGAVKRLLSCGNAGSKVRFVVE
jgi:hypothetical protein